MFDELKVVLLERGVLNEGGGVTVMTVLSRSHRCSFDGRIRRLRTLSGASVVGNGSSEIGLL